VGAGGQGEGRSRWMHQKLEVARGSMRLHKQQGVDRSPRAFIEVSYRMVYVLSVSMSCVGQGSQTQGCFGCSCSVMRHRGTHHR
jgi:hypothetical protein